MPALKENVTESVMTPRSQAVVMACTSDNISAKRLDDYLKSAPHSISRHYGKKCETPLLYLLRSLEQKAKHQLTEEHQKKLDVLLRNGASWDDTNRSKRKARDIVIASSVLNEKFGGQLKG